MKTARIAIVITREGIETVSILSSDNPKIRMEGLLLCEDISKEIEEFEKALKDRLQTGRTISA